MRGNGESGDVSVEGEVVFRVDVIAWRRFELAHYLKTVNKKSGRGGRGVVL